MTEFDDMHIVSIPCDLMSFASWTRASTVQYSVLMAAKENSTLESRYIQPTSQLDYKWTMVTHENNECPF